jgi:hypothetical protein
MKAAWLLLLLCAAPLRAQDEGDGTTNYPGLINTGGYIVFYNSEGPMAYVPEGRPPKERVELGEVTARSCQYGVSIPLEAAIRPAMASGAAGDGSYEKALKRMKKANKELGGIYDVKVDMNRVSVLGVFHRLCTIVTARGWR